MADFKPVNADDKFFDEICPLLIGIGPNGDILGYGTCFIASPCMAITAKHVIEELLNQDPQLKKTGHASIEYWIIQVVWEGAEFKYVVWTIQEVGISAHTDIATIWLRPYDVNADAYLKAKSWKRIAMTFDPPEVGETVRAFGIHDVSFEGSRTNLEGKFEHVATQTKKSIATGVVREHFWTGRDNVFAPFPCFEVDSKFESGMSGGLVLNEKSQICGVVSSSLHSYSEDEPHVSCVAMLWPMLAIPVPSELVSGAEAGSNYYLRDMVKRGVLVPQGWERVTFKEPAPGQVSLNYLPLPLAGGRQFSRR